MNLLSRKEPVKIFVAANPNPNPDITFKSLRHSSVIATDAD